MRAPVLRPAQAVRAVKAAQRWPAVEMVRVAGSQVAAGWPKAALVAPEAPEARPRLARWPRLTPRLRRTTAMASRWG